MENETVNTQSPVTTFEEKSEDVGSFTVFLRFLRRFWILIVLLAIVGAAVGIGLAFVKDKKVYTQTKSIVVIAKIDNAQMTTNIALTKKWWPTLPNTITQPIFISKANDVYKEVYNGTSGKISKGSLAVKTGSGMIMTVSYSDYDEKAAAKKLDAFIEAASAEIQNGYVTADDVEFKELDRVPTPYVFGLNLTSTP